MIAIASNGFADGPAQALRDYLVAEGAEVVTIFHPLTPEQGTTHVVTTYAAGARIAGERAVGWNRQLRITPLTTRAYFRAKVITGYAMAVVTLALLFAAGTSLGVRIPAHEWVGMTVLMLVGLVPFAAIGIVFGHLLTVDSIGPVMGGSTALLALLGGTWFPITGGVMQKIAEALPSYWLVQAGHVGVGGSGWNTTGWLVIAAWTVAFVALARRAYRRDTQRV